MIGVASRQACTGTEGERSQGRFCWVAVRQAQDAAAGWVDFAGSVVIAFSNAGRRGYGHVDAARRVDEVTVLWTTREF
jgi:hypothetical protein